MSARIMMLSFLFVTLTPLVWGDTTVQQAQAAWAQRGTEGSTEKAIKLWQQALQENPHDSELWIALTQAGARATRHANTSADKKRWADRSRAWGEKAVETNPQKAEAHVFYGEALGQWADVHKGISSLKRVKQAVAELQKALALDPKNGYAHMLLSEFYRQAPSVISVGDKTKSLEQARLAVQDAGDHAISHLCLAQILLDLGQKSEATTELQTVLSLPPPPDAVPETRSDQETAREMLKSLGVTPTTTAMPDHAWSPATSVGACSQSSTAPGPGCQSSAN